MATDRHGNKLATEGCTFCWCGAKYWENDICVSCGERYHPDMDAICSDCGRPVHRPGQYEIQGHQLCSARCYSNYERRCRQAARH